MPKGGQRMRQRGTVTSNKMNKTVVVVVERRTVHPLYRKTITRRKKYSVHDAEDRCNTGDVVEIVSSKPFSKTKTWAVSKILKSVQPSSSPVEAVSEKEVAT